MPSKHPTPSFKKGYALWIEYEVPADSPEEAVDRLADVIADVAEQIKQDGLNKFHPDAPLFVQRDCLREISYENYPGDEMLEGAWTVLDKDNNNNIDYFDSIGGR